MNEESAMRRAESLCGWCSRAIQPEDVNRARQGKIEWHADCFVKLLAHKDELDGIIR